MPLLMWMYDIAREQSPSEDFLDQVLTASGRAGYHAVGFYLEHRFAYPSAPWAAGPGALTPEVVRQLAAVYSGRGLRIVPFLNTLGHMEGFIRAEGGQWLAEGPCEWPGGIQICPTRPECAAFARGLIDDALAAFDDEWVHIGGDETRQLGQCPACAARVAEIGKGGLYGAYFGEFCRYVLARGRRPCLWADMLLQHPDALSAIPRETVLFDWQYFTRPRETTARLRAAGFDVVSCPSIQTYNSAWCFLNESQRNIDEHAEDAAALGALGVCVTTWEHCYFSQHETTLPLVYAAGRRLSNGLPWADALRSESSAGFVEAADILGHQIPASSEFLKPGTWRQLRDRFVIRQNSFYLWQDWRSEVCGPVGDQILRLCDQASRCLAPDGVVSPHLPGLHFVVELHRIAVAWVHAVEEAYRAYSTGDLSAAAGTLHRAVDVLNRLRPALERAAAHGGSAADPARLDRLKLKVIEVVDRILRLPRDAAFRPAFETLIHDGYLDGDQAAWRTAAYR